MSKETEGHLGILRKVLAGTIDIKDIRAERMSKYVHTNLRKYKKLIPYVLQAIIENDEGQIKSNTIAKLMELTK